MTVHSSGWTSYILQLDELPPLNSLWEQELVAELQRWVPRQVGLTVLEIGCSNGRWLRWFGREYGALTFGVDIDPVRASMVENFVLADGLRLPMRDGVFDIVFSMGLIEHFANPRLRYRLLAEHVRAAKPETGIVWLEHPNMNLSLSWLWTKYYYDYRHGYKHYRVTDREMKRHFQALGVQVLSTRFLDWFPSRLPHIIGGAIHKCLPCLPEPLERTIQRKPFEHPLTADDFLIIGRRTGNH